ncbi:tRNA lysidine(34) synthetase TilS [Vibrio sp. T187]|uniref:tRNA lysidine(34) synthetase TilS n=1 Tax=Vibrio TaxID=662 RepID=UPI0010C97A23|nr:MULTISPECIES: tRNA lysidine(34) synthetase TilS [Vibrio]MBW3694367.1 tRNA lysidine(34) synthetase TilS [Vibrio sp. T187]
MSSLFETFTQSIQQLPEQPCRLVLAYSGGVDSRVLLELMAEYRKQLPDLECLAVHVHHGLSENADQWVEHCQQTCEQLNILVHIERVSLDLTCGESIEKLARDARYHALNKHLNPGDVLLTGQHSDDQVETFLLALKRGSGPKGLSSMAAVKQFGHALILRPLLDASREQVVQYAQSKSLAWVEDESNTDQRFERNFIRHEVTPVLSERWPSFRQSVQRSAQLCAEQETLLDELLTLPLEQAIQKDQSLSIAELSQHSPLLRARLIRMWLEVLGSPMPSQKQLQLIWQEVANAQNDANPELKLAGGTIRRFANRLYLVGTQADVSGWSCKVTLNQELDLPDSLGKLLFTSDDGNGRISLPTDSNELWGSFNPEGLSAHPVGRGHSRKLKKLFQEYQVPSWLRRRTPILMYQNQVVAVADLFVDKSFEGQDCDLIWSKG